MHVALTSRDLVLVGAVHAIPWSEGTLFVCLKSMFNKDFLRRKVFGIRMRYSVLCFDAFIHTSVNVQGKKGRTRIRETRLAPSFLHPSFPEKIKNQKK
jgi:hypothetical protein